MDQNQVSISDRESGIAGPAKEKPRNFSNGLIELEEGDGAYEIIKKQFLSGLSSSKILASEISIRKNCLSTLTKQARANSFQIFVRAMGKKYGGNANLKYAWFGGSKDEIMKIIHHGFSHCVNNRIYLAMVKSSFEGLKSSITDKDGLNNVLLCHVIMGRMEKVDFGSEQSYPSSEEFDSGVDDLVSPNNYIVWSSNMNTHILPEYVISFRARIRMQDPVVVPRIPTSPWMPFPELICTVSKFLARDKIGLISKYYDDYKKEKVLRHELIKRIKDIAGDKLLVSVIKSYSEGKLMRNFIIYRRRKSLVKGCAEGKG